MIKYRGKIVAGDTGKESRTHKNTPRMGRGGMNDGGKGRNVGGEGKSDGSREKWKPILKDQQE